MLLSNIDSILDIDNEFLHSLGYKDCTIYDKNDFSIKVHLISMFNTNSPFGMRYEMGLFFKSTLLLDFDFDTNTTKFALENILNSFLEVIKYYYFFETRGIIQ